MTVRSHRFRRRTLVAGVLAITALVAVGAVAVDAFSVREKLTNLERKIELLVDPPPDRAIAAAVRVTPEPEAIDDEDPGVDEITPEPTVTPSVAPGETAPPAPTPTPRPQKVKVDVNLLKKPDKWFITQLDKESCAVAGTQMVIALHGKGNLSESFQHELERRIDEWESRRDSLNGGWGPAAMVMPSRPTAPPATRSVPTTAAAGAAGRGRCDLQVPRARPAARVAGRPHLGDDRLPRRRRPAVVQEREGQRRLHPRPVVSAGLDDLGRSDPPGTLPGRGRDGPQLPALDPTRGRLPRPRRQVHRRRADRCRTTAGPTRLRLAGAGASAGSARRRASARRGRCPRSATLVALPAANASGIATTPERRRRAASSRRRDPESDERREDREDRVVGRVERP